MMDCLGYDMLRLAYRFGAFFNKLSALAGFSRLYPAIEFSGIALGNAQGLPLAVLEMFRQNDNLAAVIGVMRNLSIDGLQNRMRFTTNRNCAAQVRVCECIQRGKQTLPTVFPHLQQRGASGRRLDEFRVPLAAGLLSIRCQEIRPTRPHIAGRVFHHDGDRVRILIQQGIQLLVRDLRNRAIGQLLVVAKQRLDVLKIEVVNRSVMMELLKSQNRKRRS